ncbi:hypothetical protein Hanom_Chr05g00474901 [Helianthus anomalus]
MLQRELKNCNELDLIGRWKSRDELDLRSKGDTEPKMEDLIDFGKRRQFWELED